MKPVLYDTIKDLIMEYGQAEVELALQYIDDELWHCNDCEMHCGDEYYMVHDVIWAEATESPEIMLCIGCLEDRINRTLDKRDFPDYPVNLPEFSSKSARLMHRLTREPECPEENGSA